MSIGNRLKIVRGATTQDDFAKLMEVSKNSISRWERGEQVPDTRDLQNLLKLRPDVNPAWLLTGEGDISREKTANPSVAEIQALRDKEVKLLRSVVSTYLEICNTEDISIASKEICMIYRFFIDNPPGENISSAISKHIKEWYSESMLTKADIAESHGYEPDSDSLNPDK